MTALPWIVEWGIVLGPWLVFPILGLLILLSQMDQIKASVLGIERKRIEVPRSVDESPGSRRTTWFAVFVFTVAVLLYGGLKVYRHLYPTRPQLDLVLRMSGFSSADRDHISRINSVVITNKSSDDMSLSFSLFTRLDINGTGQLTWLDNEAHWNGIRGQKFSGDRIVNLPAKRTIVGHLDVYFLEEAAWNWARNIYDSSSANAVLVIRDHVNGVRVGCHMGIGYPPEIPAPFDVIASPIEIFRRP